MTSTRTLTKSFTGGELTPEFFGKIDDNKYQTGLALCRNFEILPHGPAANRAGFSYVSTVKNSATQTRLIPFTFSTTQTFAIEVGNLYFRWHTNGSTLLAGSPTAWSSGTAYVIGDLVSLSGTNYYCILGHPNHTPPNATYWYAMPGTIYEIPTPYAEADLFSVHFVQAADVLTLVHPIYAPSELRRLGGTDWVLQAISFVSTLTAPGSISAVASPAAGSGTISMSYTVTAIGSTGIEEGLAGTPASCTNNLNTTGNLNTISWSSVTNASRYNVYKQSNGLYGYIGQTDGVSFVDDNIVADVSKTPPIASNPFSGTNNYPAAVSYFEQRRDFAGTNNLPQNFWMTRSGTESNLSYSIPSRDDDAIAYRVAAREANTIRHIVPLRNLIFLTSAAEWQVTSVNSDAITPTSISIKPQSYIGASNVQPVIINNNLLYAAARGGHVREMAYAWQANGYLSNDVCLRAPHLFDGFELKDMCYSKSPYPIMYTPSTSGNLLGFTYVPEQQIGAWHHHDTATGAAPSAFESSCTVAEGAEDVLYVIVRRRINGAWVRYVERKASRRFTDLADAFFVDAGFTYDVPLAITAVTNASPGVLTSAAHGLSNGDIIDLDSTFDGMNELEGGRYLVANKTTNTFTLTDEQGVAINTTGFVAYLSGGNARKAITSLSGITWLEGETINLLGNGCVEPQQVVTSGAITLTQPYSRVQGGLPIIADIQTLPMTFETQAFGQGRVKNVNKIYLRVFNSSGIFAGPSFDKLREAKQRTVEVYGTPPNLLSREVEIKLTPAWADSGQVCVRQIDPLPLTITSMTIEASIGA